jgi:hypothetical protein
MVLYSVYFADSQTKNDQTAFATPSTTGKCRFFKTCKARFSLREESFTWHDFRRTSKAREDENDKPNKRKQKTTRGVQRRAPHHHHY